MEEQQPFQAEVSFHKNNAEVEPDAHRAIRFMWSEMNKQKLSQEDVARIAGLSSSLFRKWREGKREPKLMDVEKVMNVMGYGLMCVPFGKKHLTPKPSGIRRMSQIRSRQKFEQRILNAVRHLPEAHITAIAKYSYSPRKRYNGLHPRIKRGLASLKEQGKVDGPFEIGRKKVWKIQKAHDR